MICNSCQIQIHDECYDKTHATLYRSCTCQHRPRPKQVKEEAKVGESVDG